MEKIKIEQIFEDSKRLYGFSSEVRMLQGDLENMLNAIEKNAKDYQKGRIPKDFFGQTEEKLKKESAALIRKLNGLVELSIETIGKMRGEIGGYEPQNKQKVGGKKTVSN